MNTKYELINGSVVFTADSARQAGQHTRSFGSPWIRKTDGQPMNDEESFEYEAGIQDTEAKERMAQIDMRIMYMDS